MLKNLVDGFRSLVPGSKGKEKEAPGLFDRRDQVRLQCHYQVECKLGADSFNAVVLDIGINGCRLGVARKLEKDQEIFLSYKPGGVPVGRQRLRCKAVWCHPDDTHGFLAGLVYADSPENVQHSWARRVLNELGFDPRTVVKRKAMRVDTTLPVVLQLLDHGREVHGTVENIGVGGALLRLAEPLEAGARLQLTVGPLSKMKELVLLGRVIKSRANEATDDGQLVGVRFLNHQNTPEIELLGKYVIRLLKDSIH